MRQRRALVRWAVLTPAVVAAVALLGALVYYLGRSRVTVTTVEEGRVVQAFYATGTLQPQREYPIKANMEGILDKIFVDKGDVVREGQEVAFIDSPAARNARSTAKAELDRATILASDKESPILREFDDRLKWTNEQIDNAKRDLKRSRDQLERGAATQSEVETREDKVAQLTIAIAAIQRQRESRKIDLERDLVDARGKFDTADDQFKKQTLRSPITGVVLDRPTSIGTRVAVNGHVMQVADVSPGSMVMRASVDEEDRVAVRPGQKVLMTLYAFGSTIFQGEVRTIYPQADPDRRTFEVDVTMLGRAQKQGGETAPPATTTAAAAEPFAAGMTGELVFIDREKAKANVIPSQAVQAGAVWVVRNGRLARADVTIGLRSVERAEVNGLLPGDRVVISPIGQLREGQSVRTQYIDPQTAAGLNKPKEGSAFKGFNG